MNHFDWMTQEAQVERNAIKRDLIVEIAQYGTECRMLGDTESASLAADVNARIAKIKALIEKL